MQTAIEPSVKPLAPAIVRPPIRPIIYSFPDIVAVTDVDDAFAHGGFLSRHSLMTNKHVRLAELPTARGVSTIDLVCFNQMIEPDQYLELLLELGDEPCLPHEVLGLMVQVPEWRPPGEPGPTMPEELCDRDLLAAGPGELFVFKNGCDQDSHICVLRHAQIRTLNFTPIDGPWHGNWVFGAKKNRAIGVRPT